jgi:hypothetical protein
MCACAGCSDKEEEECTEEFTDLEEDSEGEECSEEWDVFIGCVLEQLECDDSIVSIDGCEDEEKRLEHCLKEGVKIWTPEGFVSNVGAGEGGAGGGGAGGSGASSGSSGDGGSGGGAADSSEI